MKADLTGPQRFALGQISRHGVAHSARSTTALARRGLVTPKRAVVGEWQLTDAGAAALEADEIDQAIRAEATKRPPELI